MCSSIAASANQEELEERKQGISLSESIGDSDANLDIKFALIAHSQQES